MDCSPPDSSIHGIAQVRILEWVPFPSPGNLPDPGIKPASPALTGGFFLPLSHLGKPTGPSKKVTIKDYAVLCQNDAETEV